MAYSLDLRQKVIDACDRGMKTRPVAQLFGVSESWVRRLKQHRRERKTIVPKPPVGGVQPILKGQDQRIHDHFKAHPDTTILELKEALKTDASEVTVWRAAKALGYRFKKSRSMPANVSGRTSSSNARSGTKKPSRSTQAG